MSRLTRDGTAETDKEIFTFSVQLTTSRIGNLTRSILALDIYDYHTYIMVTTHYSNKQGSESRQNPSRSTHPTASETHRRRDDVSGCELQFLLFRVLPVFQNLNYKLQRSLSNVLDPMCCPFTNKLTKSDRYLARSKRFIKPPYSTSRATPIDVNCCRVPVINVLIKKLDKSRPNQF